MAVPVIQIDESNGSGQVVTQNIGSIAYASVDQNSNTPSLAQNNPVLVGQNAFEKWLRARVAVAATNSLSNFQVAWGATAPQDAAGSSTNLTFKFGVNAAFTTPTAATSTVATVVCVGAAPTTITPPANAVNAYSGYITSQMQVGAGAAGGDVTFPSPWFSLTYIYS